MNDLTQEVDFLLTKIDLFVEGYETSRVKKLSDNDIYLFQIPSVDSFVTEEFLQTLGKCNGQQAKELGETLFNTLYTFMDALADKYHRLCGQKERDKFVREKIAAYHAFWSNIVSYTKFEF